MAQARHRRHLRHLPNHIQVMCAEAKGGGTRLVLWVNGRQPVDRLDRDRPLGPGGDVGVDGHNAGKGPSRWAFDNFPVWKVRAGTTGCG